MRMLISILIPILAQQRQPVQIPDTGPATFTSHTSLVIVDVTVKDKTGKLIEGLKQSDFAVFEDGKPQKISVFEYQKLESHPEPPPKLTLDDQLKLPEAPKTTITTQLPAKFNITTSACWSSSSISPRWGSRSRLRAQDAASSI